MKNKNMEDLFQSKMNEIPEPIHLDKEWLELDAKLDKKAFMTFQWNKFNVYYLASFIVGTCLSAFSLGMHFMSEDYKTIHTYHIDTVYVSQIIRDTIYLNKKSSQLIGNSKLKTTKPSILTEQKKGNSLIEHSEIQNVKSEVVDLEPKQDLIPDPKKPVLKIKQDTIYKYDSVKISKKQWKKMKKQ